MRLRLLNLYDRLRSSYWFVPSLLAFVAVGLSFGMAELDEAFGAEFIRSMGWIYSGGPDGARGVLTAISSSVIGVAGTTFSITIAVLSLTSGQFGPRLLRGFMRDTGNQVVLGTFTATYLYCLLVLRTIRGTEQTTYVPHFSVTLGVILALLSVGVLIYFVHHVAESIQVTHIITEVGEETDETVARLFPKNIGGPEGDMTLPDLEPSRVCADAIGYVESVDADGLFGYAQEHRLIMKVEVRPGDYVMPEGLLVSIWPASEDHEGYVRGAFSLGRLRTTMQDAECAFLQLTEIAVRALSPGINDPFTAVQCLDRITASMCLLAPRGWPSPYRYDEKGDLRLFAKPFTPTDLVRAAYGHIREAAEGSAFVLGHLQKCLALVIERTKDPSLAAALKAERSRI